MPLEWSSIDSSVFHYVSYDLTRRDYNATETSSFMPLIEAQARVKLGPSSFNATSTSPIIKIEEQSHPNTGPTKFVSALDKFNESIPDCDAARRFQDKPNWCLANKGDGSRCGWRMPLENRKKIKQLLAELTELNIYVNKQECHDKLVAFTLIAVCGYQQDSVKGKIKSLLRAFNPITPDLQAETNRALTYLPEYRPYHPSESCPRSVREWVVEQAKKPLFIKGPKPTGGFQELDETKDGFLYVYWNQASFGLVKIGCTTVDVDQRLQEWEDQCRHPAEEHYRSPVRIKHVARVEKLIHTEFREHRVFEPYCHGCGRKHIEWFKGLDLAVVIERIKAWTEWITKEPYEKKLGVWRLKEGLEFELPQICAAPSESNSPKKEKASIAKESPRYHLRRRRTPGSSQNPSSPTPQS